MDSRMNCHFVQIRVATIHQSKIDPNAPNHDPVMDGIMMKKTYGTAKLLDQRLPNELL